MSCIHLITPSNKQNKTFELVVYFTFYLVRACNSIKWSTPGYGMTWREKYNCCVFISEAG